MDWHSRSNHFVRFMVKFLSSSSFEKYSGARSDKSIRQRPLLLVFKFFYFKLEYI